MMEKECDIKFTKLHAAGNDFICIDNTRGDYDRILGSPQLSDFVRKLCERRLGIGADGVVFALQRNPARLCEAHARFLEPDGSEAEICGNATACFVYWSYRNGLCPENDMLVRSKAGKARGVVTDLEAGHVMVWLPNSKGFEQNVSLGLDGFCWPVDFVHIGLPHAVTYVESLETFPVSRWGPLIRHHERFQPRGVNVNFVEVREPGKIAIRTYEFGVEAETLACGTGSCCSAVASAIRFGWPEDFFCGNKPVEVKVLAGSTIRVRFVSSNQREIANVRFETRVVPVYDGVIRPELLNEFSFLR